MDASFLDFANEVCQRKVVGWVYDSSRPSVPLVVQVLINGSNAGFALANQFRADLELAGIGDGCHGFEFAIPDDVYEIRGLDVYVANATYRLQSVGLELAAANDYLRRFSSNKIVDNQPDETALLFDSALLNALIKRGVDRASEYQANKPFPFICIDDFLPESVLDAVLRDFPEPEQIDWSPFDDGYTRRKLAFSKPEDLPTSVRNTLYFLNSRPVLEFLEALTGIDGLISDPYFVGGGLHQTENGGKLSIHVDFNRHKKLRLERRLNLLIYLNKNWAESYGGALELWNPEMSKAEIRIAPLFNRCVIFNTSEWSFHGQPDPLTCPPDRARKSLAIYYYTNGRPEEEVADPHSTVWQNRPGEHETYSNT